MFRFSLVLFIIGVVQCNDELPTIPCHFNDTLCMVEAQNRQYHKFGAAYHIDPLRVPTYILTTPELRMIQFNPETVVLSGCSITAVNLDVGNGKLHNTITCPWLIIQGAYRAKGLVLGIIPVDGEGPFYMLVYDYAVKCELDITIYEGLHEKEYLRIENITRREYDARGAIVLNYENLVKGNKQESKAANQFLNENSAALFVAYQDPIVDNYLRAYINRLTDYYSIVPLDQIYFEPQLSVSPEHMTTHES